MKIFEFINKPNGFYGLDGTPLEPQDLLLIEDTDLLSELPQGAGAGLSIDDDGNLQLGNDGAGVIDLVDFRVSDGGVYDKIIFKGSYEDLENKSSLNTFFGYNSEFSSQFSSFSESRKLDDSEIYSSSISSSASISEEESIARFVVQIIENSDSILFDINSNSKSTFTDNIHFFGLKYASDYSTNGTLDDRWIPDWGAVKAYADSVGGGGGSITGAGPGLSVDGTNIQLGSTTPGRINMIDFEEIPDVDEYFSEFNLFADKIDSNFYIDGIINKQYGGTSADIYSSLILKDEVGENNLGLQYGFRIDTEAYLDKSDNSGYGYLNLSVYNENNTMQMYFETNGFMVIEDGINNKGLEYSDDYESNFTTRSLVTKQYVDSVTTGSSKWTDVGSDIYRNSKVLIGATSFSDSTANLEVIGRANISSSNNSTYVGFNAGGSDIGLGGNAGFGRNALGLTTTGFQNTAVGWVAGYSTNGQDNTFLGRQAGWLLASGSYNTIAGSGSAYNSTSGSQNTTYGYATLFNHTNPTAQLAIGFQALLLDDQGSYNTVVGNSAFENLRGSVNNSHNVALGWNVAQAYLTMQDSIFIGSNARPSGNGQVNQIVIGRNAIGNGSNTVTLGNTSVTNTYLKGNLNLTDPANFILGTTTGTKIGTATSQKLAFWNATPIIQPTTAIAEAAFVENSGGTAINVDSTFGGYTLQQVIQALKNIGLLA